jgi:hypothetical protein
MNSPALTNRCPVCGYDLGFPPWRGTSASDEICPSCGIQFGYDDAAGGDELRRMEVYDKWRSEWVRAGMKWQSGARSEPPDWDPAMQLIRAGLTYH